MRGKVEWVSENMDDLGITPAYAGKSPVGILFLRFFQDPPRLCGEKFLRYFCLVHSDGITPAYAGKSLQSRTDNPLPLGSPPPMRGKDRLYDADDISN